MPLLRQDKTSGSTVVIDSCSDPSASNPIDNCYEDECVPPGVYRYGFATPYDCHEAGCGEVARFAEVSVVTPLSASCAASGASAPITNQSAPWSASDSRFVDCDSGFGCTAASAKGSPRRGVRVIDTVALGVGLLLMGSRVKRGHRAKPRSP
jgi:hypothetical protein